MKKQLKDYLHLYLGCRLYLGDKKSDSGTVVLYGENLHKAINLEWKPILRPLTDMTEDEETEYTSLIDKWNFGFRRNMLGAASATKYLLSKHLDLFGLIESGLAIDATIKK